MAFSLDPHIWLANLLVRIDGPGQLRFVLQPLVAIFLGVRDGRRDAMAGRPPYVSGLFFDVLHRRESLRSGVGAISKPFLASVLIDAVLSHFVLGAIYPVSTLFVGIVLVAVPYVLARELTVRAMSSRWFARTVGASA